MDDGWGGERAGGEQGCSGAETRGVGVPHFFRQGGRVPNSPDFFGLKFVQKLVTVATGYLPKRSVR